MSGKVSHFLGRAKKVTYSPFTSKSIYGVDYSFFGFLVFETLGQFVAKVVLRQRVSHVPCLLRGQVLVLVPDLILWQKIITQAS